MLVKVLKPFKFSLDGVTAKEAALGTEVEVRDADAAGLKSEGFVADIDDVAANPGETDAIGDDGPAPEAPATDLDAMKRAELDAYAATLGLDTTEAANKAEAKAMIEAEHARLDAAATPEADPTA